MICCVHVSCLLLLAQLTSATVILPAFINHHNFNNGKATIFLCVCVHLCTKYQHNCTCIQTHLIHTFCCKIMAGWFCSLHSHLSLVTSQWRVKVRINQYSNFSFSTQISHLWATHIHTHTHMGEYSDHTQLNLHSLKRAANR